VGISFCLFVLLLYPGDISLPNLDDSDIESDTSITSTHNVQLHEALRLACAVSFAVIVCVMKGSYSHD